MIYFFWLLGFGLGVKFFICFEGVGRVDVSSVGVE